jgi:4-hydroxybenzoate polyprenyltransferase
MHYIRLVRPVNLIIIALTMYSTRMFLYVYEELFTVKIATKSGEGFDFFLLVFSTVLIAAAGNIINDYFDVKADRINKPGKQIISKYIGRKKAILCHWVINFIAFSIAIYLSARHHTFWYVFIHLLSINALWFYSVYFKRKPFIGNLIIACLTALVPILCGVHFFVQYHYPLVDISHVNGLFENWIFRLHKGHFILILALFAFTTNLSREIIKDVEDMEGDKKISAKTLPIRYGIKTAKTFASVFVVLTPVLFGSLFFHQLHYSLDNLWANLQFFIPVLLGLSLLLFCFPLLQKAESRVELGKVGKLMKIAMFLGIIQPFYWLLFL